MTDTPSEDITLEDAPAPEQRTRQASRRYPPLLSILVALGLAIWVMPSSLNLPQTNPTQTVEYAPVPPDDNDDSPPTGNLSSLGLGSSSGIDGEGAPGGDGPGGLPPRVTGGQGANPPGLRCVRDARGQLRQTADPLSPPCVPFFDGDNFGSTYQGVTEDEIRIVLYSDSNGFIGTSRGEETPDPNTLIDLAEPPEQDDFVYTRQARIWQEYFNTRYQTYGRFIHFYIYYASPAGTMTPENRRADAAEVYRLVQPFATLDFSDRSGGGDDFVDTLARRGVLNFGSVIGQDNTSFSRYPGLIWGFPPSLEIQADMFSSVLCNNYVGQPVDHSPTFMGEPRQFGLVYTTDQGFESLVRIKDRVMASFADCGGTLATEEGTFPRAGFGIDTETSPRYAAEQMTQFQAAGVTTIIWPGGLETNYSDAMKTLNYYPEILLLGDGNTDSEFSQQGYRGSHGQDQDAWSQAVVVSNQAMVPESIRDAICFMEQRSIDPDTPQQDASIGCDLYDSLRQLFTGIQAAGPRLGPSSIDRGFHAIPALASLDLQTPSCYYDPGDYTCVKDYVLLRYDPDGSIDRAAPGCYRIVGPRRRILADPAVGNAMDEFHPDADPCINYSASIQQNIGPPDPTQL